MVMFFQELEEEEIKVVEVQFSEESLPIGKFQNKQQRYESI